MALYLKHLLPAVTAAGDDSNYGSCAMYDVLVLQARLSTSQWLVSCREALVPLIGIVDERECNGADATSCAREVCFCRRSMTACNPAF